MKVQLREIPCHRSIGLGPDFVETAIGDLPMRAALERPSPDPEAGAGQAELDLYLEGDNVFARGTLKGAVVVACGRCLGPAAIRLDDDILTTFLPKSDMPEEREAPAEPAEDEEEATFEEDDVDVYPYEGEAIDLEPLLRERLILAVPFAPLCKADCKGLCPVCGADLNQADCGHDRRPVDPRLAALKDLKV
jgi:uncharacterized protein